MKLTRTLINITQKLHPAKSRSECACLTGQYLAWGFIALTWTVPFAMLAGIAWVSWNTIK